MPRLQLGALELAYPSGHQCQAVVFMVLIIDGQRRTTKALLAVGWQQKTSGENEGGGRERPKSICMRSAWERLGCIETVFVCAMVVTLVTPPSSLLALFLSS